MTMMSTTTRTCNNLIWSRWLSCIQDSQIFLLWFSPFQSQIPLFVILGLLNVRPGVQGNWHNLIPHWTKWGTVFVRFHNLHFGSHAFLVSHPLTPCCIFKFSVNFLALDDGPIRFLAKGVAWPYVWSHWGDPLKMMRYWIVHPLVYWNRDKVVTQVVNEISQLPQ